MQTFVAPFLSCMRGYSGLDSLMSTTSSVRSDSHAQGAFLRFHDETATGEREGSSERDAKGTESRTASPASTSHENSSAHDGGKFITLPSSSEDQQAELAAMRRALMRVEESIEKGIYLDPQIALHAELGQIKTAAKGRGPFASVRGMLSMRPKAVGGSPAKTPSKGDVGLEA